MEVDGISFETLVPERVLRLPEKKRGVQTTVQIGIGITNNTPTPLRFRLYGTLTPELLGADGQAQERGGGRDGIHQFPSEVDFPLAMPGECITFFPEARLLWLKRGQFRLLIIARDGSFSWFDNLNLGTYQIQFRYQKISESREGRYSEWEPIEQSLSERVWSGRVDTPFVKFHLV